MATRYNVDKYIQGINGFGNYFCDTVYNVTLAANTEATVTVPGIAAMGNPTETNNNKFVAVMNYKGDAKPTFVTLNATAAVPAGSSFAAATSSIEPPGRVVKAGDVIHMVSAGTPSVSVEFYTYVG